MSQFQLSKTPKIKPGFKVPQNYFDTLPQRIVETLEKKPKVLPFYQSSLFKLAAAVVLLAVLLPIGIKTFSAQATSKGKNTAIENYFSYNSELTSLDLLSLLSEEEMATLELEYTLDLNAIESTLLQNSNIEMYILD